MSTDLKFDIQTQNAIQEAVSQILTRLPEQLGIDESIPGCEVISMDTYNVGAGTLPRYITAALRGGPQMPVFYRGGISGLGVGDSVLVTHFRDGDRYEVTGVAGTTGTVSGNADIYVSFWVYDVSLGILIPYTTIALALAYALLAAGDYILCPPGTFDASFTLVNGVYICEQIPGTTIFNSTSADTCVTTVAGGYINVKEIRVTRNVAAAIYAVYSTHGAGTSTVIAEIIAATQTGTGDVYGVYHVGAGTQISYFKRIEVSASNGKAYGCRGSTGAQYAWGERIVVTNTSANSTFGVYAGVVACTQYIRSGIYVTGGSTAIGVYAFTAATLQEVWGNVQVITTNNNAMGIALYGTVTTQIVHGNVYAEAASAVYGIYCNAYSGVSSQYVYGNVSGVSTGGASTSYGAYIIKVNYASSQEVFGYAKASGGTTSVGSIVVTSADSTGPTQRIHDDVSGSVYGARCEAGTQTLTGGIATGGTYDLIRTGGTLQIASVSYATYSGTITLLSESLNALQLALVPTTELTIAAGVITKTQSYHRVDTQGDAASDDLDTINGATATGEILVLRPEDDARTVVVKHNTGNIWLVGKADISLDDLHDHIELIYDGTMWCDMY